MHECKFCHCVGELSVCISFCFAGQVGLITKSLHTSLFLQPHIGSKWQ